MSILAFLMIMFLIFAFLFAPKIKRFLQNRSRGNIVWGEPDKEQDSTQGVPLVITIDDGYCLQAVVMLTSLMENAEENTFYKIDVLVPNEFSEDSKKKILSIQETYGKNCKIEFINMKNCFTNSYISKHFTNTVYYRLRIPDVLQTRKRCIYLDADMIVNSDLTELYDVDLHDKWLGGVADSVRGYKNEKERVKRESYRKSFEIESLQEYINSGVLLLDLDVLRKNNIEEKFEAFLKKYKDPSQHDQTVINSVCYGKILSLPLKFNTQAFMYTHKAYGKDEEKFSQIFPQKEWEEAWENPRIIHFAGEKPWNDPSTFWIEKWWNTARKTQYWKEIVEKFRTTK
jgi:lipopolysaccharide biosynthesis glycosyltransferase